MRFKKLVWHIFPANLLITVGSLLAILWYSSFALDQFYINWLATDLENRAYFLEEQVSDLISNNSLEELNTFCRRIGRKTSTRITVINPSGTVVADSDETPKVMRDHSNRPEVKTALNGSTGTMLRFSPTLGVTMLYVAIPLLQTPIEQDNKGHILRTATPASAIDQTLQSIRVKVAISSLIVALLAVLAAILVSRKISKPLEKMTEGAEQFAQENFTSLLTIPSNCSLEVGALAAAMNSMAQKLQERFSTIVHQKNELQTILTSLADAVLVIDNRKQIKTINTAASSLFDVQPKKGVGKSTQEVLRNINIERLVNLTLACKDMAVIADEIVVNKGEEKLFLHYRGVKLYDDNGDSFGAVLAFNDVTNIRKLENIRQEFVANVSHELMTPLTSIKGYTETILESTQRDPEQTSKFLLIILRQSNRLQAIVSDLLNLSRIEKEIEHNEIHLVKTNVKNMLEQAIEVCSHKAAEKYMNVLLDCPVDFVAHIDAQLMEQATVNLLVNAIKYSEPSNTVEIKAYQERVGNTVETAIITVRDFGVGIDKEHLPRLFERFYRSDKDRSRKLGGTGLGLAIVKHIAQAHNGRVGVESEVGKGTIFTISFPATGRNHPILKS